MRLKGKTDYIFAICFLIPTVFFLGVFIIYPIINSFQLSFFRWNGIDPVKQFIGFGNWIKLFHDKIFFKAVGNNFIVVFFSIVTQIPLSIILAIFLDSLGKKFTFLKTVYFLPLLMSTVAVGILFKYIYDPQFGLFAPILNFIGLEKIATGLLSNVNIVLYSVMIIISWQWIPFYMIYFLAAISYIPIELKEAAIIDGATENQYTFKILIPLLKGYITTAIVIVTVGSLKYFDLIYVLTDGGPSNASEIMATYMFKKSFNEFITGYSSAIAGAQFLITIVIAIFLFFIIRNKVIGDIE